MHEKEKENEINTQNLWFKGNPANCITFCNIYIYMVIILYINVDIKIDYQTTVFNNRICVMLFFKVFIAND